MINKVFSVYVYLTAKDFNVGIATIPADMAAQAAGWCIHMHFVAAHHGHET